MLPGAPRAELRLDVYVQARYNRSATERVLVVDTAEVHLPAGRRRVTTTFVVPVLDLEAFPRDRWQSLELAFRPILARTMAGAVLSVREAVLAGRSDHEWAADPRTREVVEVLLAGVALGTGAARPRRLTDALRQRGRPPAGVVARSESAAPDPEPARAVSVRK